MKLNLMKAAVAGILIAILGLSTGCGELQKAIDKIKTQDVDYYQGIYSGDPVRSPVSLSIVKDAVVSPSAPMEANAASVWDVAENVLAMQAEVPDLQMGLSGKIVNNGGSNGRVYIFFAPTSTPTGEQAQLIGSVVVGPGKTLEFKDSEGFDQTPDDVQSNLRDYFNANPTAEIFHVFLFGENVSTGSLVVSSLLLDSTPAFAWMDYIPSDFLSGSSDNVKGLASVNVSGTFINNGTEPVRLTWVVGPSDENLTIGNNAVLDGWIQPGQAMDAAKALVVPEGLQRLKSQMKDLIDGAAIKANLILTSSENVDTEIDDFRVEFVAEVGI